MKEPWFNRNLGISIALIFLGVIIFAIAGYSAVTETLLFRFDHPIANFMDQLNESTPEPLKLGAMLLDLFGNFGTDAIALFLLVLFAYRREWRKASLIFFGLPVAGLVWLAIVYLVDRPRPEVVYLLGTDFLLPSFPSGHVWTVLSFYGVLLYMYWSQIDTPLKRSLLVALYVLFVLFTGFVRMYHQGHFFTDVIGGIGGGLAWLVLVIVLVEAVSRRETRRISAETTGHPARDSETPSA